MIDLGKMMDMSSKVEEKPSKNKKYYPSSHISGIKGVDFESGDMVSLHGKVTSVTERTNDNGDTEYSCEVELHGMEANDSGMGLDGAMKKIAKRKASKAEEDDEGEY